MKVKYNRIKKRGEVIAFTFLLCTGILSFSAFAGNHEAKGPSSNVWIDVVEVSSDSRLSVTVPIGYGFVVSGTTEASGAETTEAISVNNGNLFLPNVRVKITTTSGSGTAAYEMEYSAPVMPIENYSTDVRDENMDQNDPPREGLPVELHPYIMKSTDTTSHYWKITSTPPTSADGDFKFYRMILDGKPFSVDTNKDVEGTSTAVVQLSDTIALDAPPDVPSNGHTAAGTALIPSKTPVPVDVEVGGRRGQYTQVEASVNVAQICWEIIPGTLPATTP